MTMFGAGEVLSLCERARALHLVDRALLLYAAAQPDTPWPQLADAPLGQRDAALLQLRCRCFGAGLEATVDCPRCAEPLEIAIDLEALHLPAASASEVTFKGQRLRLPSSRDLAAIAHETDPSRAAQLLLARCVLDAQEPLPEASEIQAALAAADPQADLSLSMHCDACGHDFDVDLDPAAVLWQDMERLARRTLQDVDTLARVYGWPEREILALAPHRRAAYVELARA